MRIDIAKVLIQSWVNEDQVCMFPNDPWGNFDEMMDIAEQTDNHEIIDCLEFIKSMGMVEHMLKG